MADQAPSSKPHVPAVDEAWLARKLERPIAPEVAVVDGHIHLWDFSEPAYLGDRYLEDARAAGITTSVYIECTMAYRSDGPGTDRVLGEVEFARDQAKLHAAKDHDLAAAIVGMVGVTRDSEVPRLLDAMQEAGGGRFRGIRIRAAHDADPAVGYGSGGMPAGLLRQSAVRSSLAALQRSGLSLDVYAFYTQLAEVGEVARGNPDLPIVVNHIGGPIGVGDYADQRAEVFAAWKAGMARLADEPNVFVKIGGFGISRIAIVSAKGRAEPPDSSELATAFEPWFSHCLDAFGPERCMFGSNFPVDKACMSLTTLVNAMKRLTASLSADERDAVLASTARHFYRIREARQ